MNKATALLVVVILALPCLAYDDGRPGDIGTDAYLLELLSAPDGYPPETAALLQHYEKFAWHLVATLPPGADRKSALSDLLSSRRAAMRSLDAANVAGIPVSVGENLAPAVNVGGCVVWMDSSGAYRWYSIRRPSVRERIGASYAPEPQCTATAIVASVREFDRRYPERANPNRHPVPIQMPTLGFAGRLVWFFWGGVW